ncbi:hypothetical protein GN244_ATG00622 [Phytophthora infestans]|uniref:Uncharacterized protein n=1 Tax=Phytophthora infestans TaxID=4787 RepID=A0A833TGH2_PHYIN|nr:hypothetical protein GN244_ATG00622 [Phytophthora infestans]
MRASLPTVAPSHLQLAPDRETLSALSTEISNAYVAGIARTSKTTEELKQLGRQVKARATELLFGSDRKGRRIDRLFNKLESDDNGEWCAALVVTEVRATARKMKYRRERDGQSREDERLRQERDENREERERLREERFSILIAEKVTKRDEQEHF